MNKTKFGIAAIILLLGALLTTVPLVSANTRIYASDWKIVTDYSYSIYSLDRYHMELIYNVPYNPNNRPHIGGVISSCVPADHSNVQAWTMRAEGSKTGVLVPKRYTTCDTSFYWNIYLEYISGSV